MSRTYYRHRFPVQIIQHCVWLYFTFPLSYRDVEKMRLYRGLFVTDEAIRYWCQKFGQAYANQIRRRRPKPGDKWHLDEVMVTIKGKKYYLWPAVDQAGNVLDILMQSHRNKAAATEGVTG
jgi:putative transposase